MQSVERRGGVVAEIDSDRAATTSAQCAEVAERLGLLQDAEGVRLTGNGQVGLVLRFDLEEDAGVWTALVKLSG